LTEDWDLSPQSILWSRDGKILYLVVEQHGRNKIFELSLKDKKGHPKPIVSENFTHGVHWVGSNLLLSQSSITTPSLVQLYDTNKRNLHPLLSLWTANPLSSESVDEFWFYGYENNLVHGFIVVPEGFDRNKKYPLAFLIHGGPQGAWEDVWSTRWNPAVFANAGDGWVVVAINPTGSTGYGQNFTDAIQGNWGTRPCMTLRIIC
jgi:pre-mRNA-splicing helicase BRR2